MKQKLVVCLSLCSLGLSAQSLSLSGMVTDDTGAVPQAAVTVKFGGRILVRETGVDGKYSFDGLSGGVYNVQVAKPGFDPVEALVTLELVGQIYDVKLKPGAISTTVVVTDVAGKASASRMSITDLELPAQVSSVPLATLQSQGVNDMVTALRNVSGVTARRWYGVYEYYTVRGFQQSDVMLVDGMRLEGNRINTQLNNVQQVEVLKGPSSVLYGGSALSGAINVIRKKPQGTPSYDFQYRGGRFNTHQVAGGATGPLIANRLLYRVDSSFDHSDAWRQAGSRRFNLSPTLTWLINESNRVTVHESFNRDRFKGDGGLPIGLTAVAGVPLSTRLNAPDDFQKSADSQTHVLFNSNLHPNWEFRNGFFFRYTNDEYKITEAVGYSPNNPDVATREALYFKHHRRPVLNQADVVGRVNTFGIRHNVLAGYEYQDFYNFTYRTPGGGVVPVSSINFRTGAETQPAFVFNLARIDYFANKINAFFWQDQLNLTRRLHLNVGGRLDDYRRSTRNDPVANGVQTVGPEIQRSQRAYTYRAGAVYDLRFNQQVYFSSASSFSPVTTVPADGRQLLPEFGRSFELGYRFQALANRLNSSLAFYRLERNNVVIPVSPGVVDQAGKLTSRGADLDINGDLGHGLSLVGNYGYTLPRYDNFLASNGAQNLSGNRPQYVPLHSANAWLQKTITPAWTASVGYRYVGSMFTNNVNNVKLGGYSLFSGAVSYRARNWEWRLNAENLLNRQRYFDPAAFANQVFPGSPINLFTTIKYRFN